MVTCLLKYSNIFLITFFGLPIYDFDKKKSKNYMQLLFKKIDSAYEFVDAVLLAWNILIVIYNFKILITLILLQYPGLRMHV